MKSGEATATANRDEAGLIKRILAGEKELFHELIRPYERMVYMTVFPLCAMKRKPRMVRKTR